MIENDLYEVMLDGHLSGAAIDVYENEPYSGPLTEIDRCLLTAHTGTMTRGSRSMMENLTRVRDDISDEPIVMSATKGFSSSGNMRMSELSPD